MNKKGLIIVNSFCELDTLLNQPRRLKEEFEKLNIEIDIKKTNEFPAIIKDGKLQVYLSDYSFAIYLDKDKYLSAMLEKSGLRLFNSSKSVEICDDKMLTHVCLADKGIKMPTTIPGLLCYTKDADIDVCKYDKVIKTLGFPMVIKESYGSFGQGVHLAKDEKEFLEIVKKVQYVPHLFQEFIESSSGTDIRVIVIGGKVFSAMKRKSNIDFRSNIELGGVGEIVELSSEYVNMCESVAKIIGLDYCGIDVLIGEKGEPILCEVNSNAFFGGIEKVTGKNVAKAYVEYIINEVFN